MILTALMPIIKLQRIMMIFVFKGNSIYRGKFKLPCNTLIDLFILGKGGIEKEVFCQDGESAIGVFSA